MDIFNIEFILHVNISSFCKFGKPLSSNSNKYILFSSFILILLLSSSSDISSISSSCSLFDTISISLSSISSFSECDMFSYFELF